MTVYIDTDFKCHVANDGTMTAVEDAFFDGKCPEFIEGSCLVPEGAEYEGEVAKGRMIFPWRPSAELEAAQIAYEREQYKLLLAENADMKAALELLEVTPDE